MIQNKDNEVIVIPKPDYITWEDITELLHLAFEERANQGLLYVAYTQSVETTIKRVDDGICLVALIEKKLVGTATLHINNKGQNNYSYLSQLAVLPNFKKWV